jgi:hypothetical protein
MESKFIKICLVLFVFLSGFSAAYAKWNLNNLITEYELALNSELVSTVVLPKTSLGEIYMVNTYKTKTVDQYNTYWRCRSRLGGGGIISDHCWSLSED